MIRVANEENEIWVEFPISFILWTVPLQKLNFEIFDFYVFRGLENFWFFRRRKKVCTELSVTWTTSNIGKSVNQEQTWLV